MFKLWKSEGGLANTSGKTGTRCLCEFFAKVLGQIIANWLMLTRCGQLGGVSPTKLYRQLKRSLPAIMDGLFRGDSEAILVALAEMDSRLQRVRPQKRSKKSPLTPAKPFANQ